MAAIIRKNLTLLIIMAVMAGLFAAAAAGMETQDFLITLLRGLSVGSLTFLVASGFSLIFGLLDVLNLAHGTLFMIGAYIGWTVYVRPDTFVDLLPPLAFLISGFLLKDLWIKWSAKLNFEGRLKRLAPWAGILISIFLLFSVLQGYPIAIWDVGDYAQSPVSISFMASQGLSVPFPPVTFEDGSPALTLFGLAAGSMLLAFSLSLFGSGRQNTGGQITWRSFIGFAVILLAGILIFVYNTPLTDFLNGLNSNWLFLIAVLVSVASGIGLGAMMETLLIRPLYIRPIYQLMLTLGLSAIGIEMVRAVWGRPEFLSLIHISEPTRPY